jgi:hypothetical protein
MLLVVHKSSLSGGDVLFSDRALVKNKKQGWFSSNAAGLPFQLPGEDGAMQ